MHAEVEDRVAPGSQDAYRVQARRKVQDQQMSERHHKGIQAIADQRDALSQAIVARQYELRPDLWKPYGGSGREKSACDAGYHLTYLSETLAASSPSLSSDYVAWAKVLVAGLQFPEDVLVTILECTRDELRDELDPESSALTAEYVELRLDHSRHAPASVPTFLEQHAPLRDWRGSTSTRSRKASGTLPANSCFDAVEQGAAIKDACLHVFQPTQYEIGRLSQMNRITVSHKHYCTAATQLIMSQRSP